MKQNKKTLIISSCFLILFICFTIILKTVNVLPIGPENTKVGLANFNNFIKNSIGTNLTLYKITEYLGYITLLIAATFATIGLTQWIKRKNFKKIDKEILALGYTYVLTICCYVFFEKVIINYRPIILEEGLEASYPSSHTILAIVILGTAILESSKLIKNKILKNILITLEILLLIAIVLGRLLSGVHWITDIIGGILLSSSIVTLYYYSFKTTKNSLDN